MKLFQKRKGFTLIELLIVIAIVAILAIIAVPAYLNYSKKAYFSEVVGATAPYKTAIEACYMKQLSLASCGTPGTNQVPANAAASGYISSVVVSANGVITATGNGGGITGETIILTPTVVNNALQWTKSGTCVTNTLC